MNGACVARASPEGSVCAPATTCRAESRCVNGACSAPDASTPPLAFRYTAPAGRRISSHVVGRDGALFFLEGGNPVTLKAFEKTGAPRFELDLSTNAPSLGLAEARMIDEANGRLFVTTMFGPGTEAPPNGITTFVQAFELRTGRLLWKRDVSTDVPLADGPQRVFSVQRLLLLNGGKVGVLGMEGNSLHQLHVVALDGATGAKVFQVQRAGHGDAGVTRNGTLFMRHAGCWSQQYFLTTFDDAGRQMTSAERGVFFSGFAEDGAVVWDGRRLEVLGAGLTSGTAIPFPVGHQQLSAVAWSPTESILLTQSSGGFHATSAVGQTIAWSTLVTPNRAAALSFQRLDLGRTAVFVNHPAAMVELVVLASNGAETARCLLPSSTLSISGGATVAASGNTLSIFSTPDLDTARTGWIGRNGGPQGTNRAQ